MMNNQYRMSNLLALKGQQIIAQGNALGLKTNKKIVRAITIINERLMWRTNMYDRSIHPNNDLQFRRNVNFRIVNRLCAAGFRDLPFTQGVAIGLRYIGLSGRKEIFNNQL